MQPLLPLLMAVATLSATASASAASGSTDFYKTHSPIADFDRTKLETEAVGEHPSLDFRVFYNYNDKRISPWHDIPMHAGKDESGRTLYHFLCEIPLGTTAKMEVNKELKFNPIAQDTKKGKLRFYKYKPKVGSVCNYGAIMQTWEDPNHIDTSTNAGGDDDPVDVLQINKRPCKMGELYAVKILGTLAMVDDGETDWKMIVVDAHDPATSDMQDIDDVPEKTINELREWFRLYKTAEGKPANKFGLNEKAMDRSFSEKVLEGTHGDWLRLVGKAASPTKRCEELNDENFDQKMVQEGPLFVKFYLPTCKHCQALAPIWEKLADRINPKDGERIQLDTPAKIVAVNCDNNPRTCGQVSKASTLTGFPKLKLMGVIPQAQGGFEAVVVEYKGERTLKPMESYIRGVQYVQEEKMKQAEKEKRADSDREEAWIKLEPALEKEAAEWNAKAPLKDITMKNIDEFLASGIEKEGNHFMLLLTDNGFDQSNYRGAWEEAANKAKDIDGVIFGTVNCQSGMARVCFKHPKVSMPFRFDIFPQLVLYDAANPEGKVIDRAHQKRQAVQLFAELNDDTIEQRIANRGLSQSDVDEL